MSIHDNVTFLRPRVRCWLSRYTATLCRIAREAFALHLTLHADFSASQGGCTDTEDKAAYLSKLIRQDPSIFLERYGKLLESKELECFEVHKDDYEVRDHNVQVIIIVLLACHKFAYSAPVYSVGF